MKSPTEHITIWSSISHIENRSFYERDLREKRENRRVLKRERKWEKQTRRQGERLKHKLFAILRLLNNCQSAISVQYSGTSTNVQYSNTGGKVRRISKKNEFHGSSIGIFRFDCLSVARTHKTQNECYSTWKLVFDENGFASFIYEYHRKFVGKIQLKDAIGLRSITEYNSTVNIL